MKHMRHIAKEVDDWTRVEVEFSGEYAHQLTNAIKNCNTDEELKNVIISSLIDRYMFFYIASNRPHKITRSMLELLDKKDFQFESPSPRNNLLGQSLDHLINGSGLLPVLWKVQNIWGHNTAQELLKYLYKQYDKKFKPNEDHISWLEKHKAFYLLEGKPWRDDIRMNYQKVREHINHIVEVVEFFQTGKGKINKTSNHSDYQNNHYTPEVILAHIQYDAEQAIDELDNLEHTDDELDNL